MARTDISRAQARRVRDTHRQLRAHVASDGDYAGYYEHILNDAIRSAQSALGPQDTMRLLGEEIMRIASEAQR